jgi:hypothetical protein
MSDLGRLNPDAFPAPAIPKQGDAPQPTRDPLMDGSGGWPIPVMSAGMTFSDVGSSGLRQWGGWVREEFLPQLVGRQAARTYREMLDNSPTVGAINFAIQQSMRQVDWRVEPASDKPEAQWAAEFVESLMDDMSHTWGDFITETLSMLPYGYAPHEICYKRRLGRDPGNGPNGKELPRSKYKDGLIGLRKLPIRGQDTILKWFFDTDGEILGLTQQPWVGGLIDIPIEKLLLFRPRSHKNNPEGYSILRTAYRPWFFTKRMEEQEAIMFERFSGFPVITIPQELVENAASKDPDIAGPAQAAMAMYRRIVTNVRIDEQMGALLPSTPYRDADGKPTNIPMYDFKLVTPTAGKGSVDGDKSIERYKLDIMTSVLADFLSMGHTSRGAQNLAETKVDLFFQAIEGWLQSNADVLNDHLLPRLWRLNGLDYDNMPRFQPDMPQRIDLDGLSNFVLRMSQAGARLFPDDDVENFLRDAAGIPDISEDSQARSILDQSGDAGAEGQGDNDLQKMVRASLLRRMEKQGLISRPKKKLRGYFRKNSSA